jgi:AraC-like DNA-binding protein
VTAAALPHSETLLDRVCGEIRVHIEQDRLGIRPVARALGVSERTLRRRLNEAGQTYRALREEVRSTWALVLLRGGKHTVTEVAHLVGFSDATAFARAVRRWTGTYPRDYARRSSDGLSP